MRNSYQVWLKAARMKYMPFILAICMIELAYIAGFLNRDYGTLSLIMMAIAGLVMGWIIGKTSHA